MRKDEPRKTPERATSKDHHYLPQFYLRHFVSPESRRVYKTFLDPDGILREEPVRPRSTGYEKYLYSLKKQVEFERLERPDTIETDFLQKVDDRAARALARLHQVAPSALSDDERRDWALFVNSLLERHPRVLVQNGVRSKQVITEKHKELSAAWSATAESAARWDRMVAQLDLTAMAENLSRRWMERTIADPDVIQYFSQMQWTKIQLHGGGAPAFVTGDAPVVVNSGAESRPILSMSIALGARDLLFMTRQHDLPGDLLGDAALTHNLQVIEQSRYVYSTGPLTDGQVVRTRLAALNTLRRTAWRRGDAVREEEWTAGGT